MLVFSYDMLKMGSEGRDMVVKGSDTRMESRGECRCIPIDAMNHGASERTLDRYEKRGFMDIEQRTVLVKSCETSLHG